MDNISEQIEEVEALVAIYGDEWQTEDVANREYAINIGGEKSVRLFIKLPKDYPTSASPIYEISAPHFDSTQKLIINNLLSEVCLANTGQNVIYQLIEKVREILDSDFERPKARDESVELHRQETRNLGETDSPEVEDSDCPVIIHGDVIVDRKSSFQGHVAVVMSVAEVKKVLRKLHQNKKIDHATHNIYAYRIARTDVKKVIQDYEDDGESQAGGRLLHLLEIIDVQNILVVVSRWYGGIHLGPDRFRHINNAAYQALATANLIPEKSKKK